MSEANDISQPQLEGAEPTDFESIGDEVTDGMDDDASDLDVDDAASIDAAAKAGDISKKQAAVLKKTLKVKVDGVESDEELSWDDDEGLKRHLQKSKAFDKRTKEHSAYKSQVDQMLQMLMDDPEGALEKLGIDVDGLSEKRLSKKIEEMKKSPEQLEKEKMTKELEDLRTERKKITEAKEQAEMEKMRNEAASQIQDDITTALESANSVLPKRNPVVMQRIAQTMLFAMQNGYPGVTAKDVIPIVERQFEEEMNGLFGDSSDELFERLATKGRIDKYRKAKVQKKVQAKTETAKQAVRDSGSRRVEEPKDQPKLRMKDVFDFRK